MIETIHKIVIKRSQCLDLIEPDSVHLVVTSPPYPMIEMWDEIMSGQNNEIRTALDLSNGKLAFELMHMELDKVWKEIERVVIPGGIVCINIGDATRTINQEFSLYPNHARILSSFIKMGFANLPNIIWRKQTNAPNKFMGSGMLPAGAHVTLEHEWILVFRKGGKRLFKTEQEKLMRQKSSFFWEERNVWFSDLWDLKGTRQQIENKDSRDRSAAYPFEIPYRLINMFSVKGDTVLDPFLGTGTTSLAAMASERNSIGIEIDHRFGKILSDRIENIDYVKLNKLINDRVLFHQAFINQEKSRHKEFKHFNNHIGMEVVTSQEKELYFNGIDDIQCLDENQFKCRYKNIQEAILSNKVNSLKSANQYSFQFQ